MEANSKDDTAFAALEGYGNVDELLRGVSEGMSEVTRLLAVVAGPTVLGESLARVDYLPGEGRLLLVVSMESGASSSAAITLPIPSRMMNCATSSQPSTPGWEVARSAPTWSSGSPRARRSRTDDGGAVLEAVGALGGRRSVGSSSRAPRPSSAAWTTSTRAASRP